MKAFLYSFLLSVPMLVFAVGEPVVLEYYKGDLSKIQETAASVGKLYFYQFDAEWCAPCRQLNEKAFADSTLVQFVNDNYLAARVNIDEFDGFAMKERMKVQKMPAIIVFGKDGKELERLADPMDAATLLAVLKKWRVTPEAKAAATSKAIEKVTPVGTADTDAVKFPTASAGFAIQMVTISDPSQAARSREELTRLHPGQPVFIVETSDAAGKKLFKVLLGNFPSKGIAEQYRKSKAPKGFVKDLSAK